MDVSLTFVAMYSTQINAQMEPCLHPNNVVSLPSSFCGGLVLMHFNQKSTVKMVQTQGSAYVYL